MTQRIYYTDPACASFDATVQRVISHGGHPAVILDRTAFYPSSGGQPFDTGRLGDLQVIDVVDLDSGEIAHVLESEPAGDPAGPADARDVPAEGRLVHGEIDWNRRFDHMQQHSGQHVLSAAFEHVFNARTISFHLGADSATIDLASDVSHVQIAEAEQESNRVVWNDGPVSIRFVPAASAAGLPLRKAPAREGTLRLIDIDGFDLSACGGTHVARTGSIGVIAVIGWEKFKGGVRVTFVCGGRALRALRHYRDTVAGSIRLLSVSQDELPSAIGRLQDESRDLRRSVKHLTDTAAVHEGKALAERAPLIDGRRVIVAALDTWDANGIKAIASAATAGDSVVAALFSTTTTPATAVIATSKDVPVDASTVLKALVARFGGRGGGKPDLAQGGGFTAPIDDLLTAARELL